jgi:hypothetical protein
VLLGSACAKAALRKLMKFTPKFERSNTIAIKNDKNELSSVFDSDGKNGMILKTLNFLSRKDTKITFSIIYSERVEKLIGICKCSNHQCSVKINRCLNRGHVGK